MERSKYFIILFLSLACYTQGQNSHKAEIYHAYINREMTKWKQIIDKMNLHTPKNNAFRLELAGYQSGYIAWCIGVKKKKRAMVYLSMAAKNARILKKNSYALSSVYALKAAFSGYRIGLNILNAPTSGPKSLEYAKMSIFLDKNNPLGYVQYGNIQYYRPLQLGGSKLTALSYYEKALALMETDKHQIKKNWNYLNLLVMIARSHSDLVQYEKAKSVYEKILRIEPHFLWVKEELYPELLRKME